MPLAVTAAREAGPGRLNQADQGSGPGRMCRGHLLGVLLFGPRKRSDRYKRKEIERAEEYRQWHLSRG